MEIPESPVEGLIKFSKDEMKAMEDSVVKVEESSGGRNSDDEEVSPPKMSRLATEAFSESALISSQDLGVSGGVSLQDAAGPSPKVNDLVSTSDLKEAADSTTQDLWHNEGIHSPGSVLPMELPSLSDGLHSPDVCTNSSTLSSPGLDSTGLSTPPPPLLQAQHLLLQDPLSQTVHWTATTSPSSQQVSQHPLLAIPASGLTLKLDGDLKEGTDSSSSNRLTSSEQFYNQAALNLVQKVSHALDDSLFQEVPQSMLPGMDTTQSLLQPQFMPIPGASQLIPVLPNSNSPFILQYPHSHTQTLSSPPLVQLTQNPSTSIANISPIVSTRSPAQANTKNAMIYRTADGSTVEMITNRTHPNRGDIQNSSSLNQGCFQSTPNQPVGYLPSSAKLLQGSPLLPPSHLPSESLQVPPTLFLSSLTRPTNVYSLPAQGLLPPPPPSSGSHINEPYSGTPHPILTGRTVLPTPIVSPSAPLLKSRSSKRRNPHHYRSQNSSSSSHPFATPQSDVSYRLNTPSISLNSSGSEDDRSPPDHSFAAPPQVPYNTPVDGVSSSTHGGLPSADYLSAAVMRARCEPDALDLSATREQHNAKERQRRARIKEACDKLRDLMPGGMSRTDKATLIELCVEYIKHLRQYVGDDSDRDFLKKTPPFLNMCDYD